MLKLERPRLNCRPLRAQRPGLACHAQIWNALFEQDASRWVLPLVNTKHHVQVTVTDLGTLEVGLRVEDRARARVGANVLEGAVLIENSIAHNCLLGVEGQGFRAEAEPLLANLGP